MDERTIAKLEPLFLALSDRTRLKLVSLIAPGEVSVGYLADKIGESQPKVSRHLAYLRSTGLVTTRREGKWIYYGLEPNLDPVVSSVINSAMGDQTRSIPDRRSTTSTSVPERYESELPIHLL
jgi:ArsR family transcriptional regulator, arsenate/arsenite/antimonite-responsive transcriptional repressor